ncbi:amino acid dehydrogenase [Steroidobacter agaridevorans]|uniref:Amino acid dehydrogenase n=1 Tax=Steroidobacter agaridevorans TaxID=2695856 RepID=A0A829YAQ5_9GAMM|nr:FAD-dependent oxidoreductase [Steroidobacter agaridevorans]GFE79928.1 amino acid dehydrogenase [Steroidobacter agaridevorans]
MQRAVVLGGGVVGLSIAAGLQRVGVEVTVFDTAPAAGAASWGNAGHIAIEQVEPLASWPVLRSGPRRLFSRGGALGLPPSQIKRWLPFALRMASAAGRVDHGREALRSLLTNALPAWKSLTEQLGVPGLVRETGHFVVWETPVSAAAGLAAWRSADIGNARFHECDADEMRLLAGLVKQAPAGAIRFENTGQIADLPKLADALRGFITARGGRIVNAKARAVVHRERSVSVTLDDGSSVEADFAVIAAGVRSRELIEPYCSPVPIIAERGYHLQMTEHGWPDLPPVVFEDRSMIVTRFESGLRAASFVEFSDIDAPPDERKWQRLRSHVAALGLPCNAPTRQWMGARPTLPDYLPAIGRLPHAPNILYGFGHQHLGLTLAAITGELIAQLATNSPTAVSLKPFDLQRFS